MSANCGLTLTDADISHNPLDCLLCQQELKQPVRLPCHHSFCLDCVRSMSTCPLCSMLLTDSEHVDEEGSILPLDNLVSFLIDTSHESAEICANCDKMSQPMHFCETCQQPLCNQCRVSTHQAKMFVSHRVVLHEERSRVKGRVNCSIHEGEPFILFSTENRRLACINCFKAAMVESRHHFLNVESAHKLGVERMEKVAMKLRIFQESCTEQIQLRRRLLSELETSHRMATTSVQQTCQEMIETLISARDRLINQLEQDYRTREQHFREQLTIVRNLQLPIQLYLFGASIFCSTASKLDFLHCSSDLIKRMKAVMAIECPRPLYTGAMTVAARDEFAQALEPLLGLSSLLISINAPTSSEKLTLDTMKPNGYAKRTSADSSISNYHGLSSISHYHGLSSISNYQLIVDLAGAFGEQFDWIAGPLKQYNTLVSMLSREVQEAQRDLTTRKRIIEAEPIAELNARCTAMETRLAEHSLLIQERQPLMALLWQEQLDRVRRQQVLFREKVEDTVYLRDQIRRLSIAARQLEPFANSLQALVRVIDRRRCHPPDPAPMELICHEINTIEPDSLHRCQAIEKEEAVRRLAQEKRKDEQNAMAISAKRQLKLNKDQRRTQRDGSHGLSCPVSIMTRDRSRGGTDPAMVSPSKRRQRPIRDESSDGENALDSFQFSAAMANESVEMTRIQPMKLSRSQTLHVPMLDREIENHAEISRASSLPEEPIVPDPEHSSPQSPSTTGRPPRVPFVPPMVFANKTTTGAWEAREKLLESLKQKVQRLEPDEQ